MGGNPRQEETSWFEFVYHNLNKTVCCRAFSVKLSLDYKKNSLTDTEQKPSVTEGESTTKVEHEQRIDTF